MIKRSNSKVKYLLKRFILPHESYLRLLKPYILFSSLIFGIAIILGYYVAIIFPSYSQETISLLKETYEPILETSTFSQILFIFLNNGIASFLVIITGVVFGIIPIIGLINNGGILGMISKSFLEEYSFYHLLAGILPHGIVEIPLFLISCSIGLKLGRTSIGRIFKKEGSIKEELNLALNTFLKLILILLFFVAIIEVLITPVLFRIL